MKHRVRWVSIAASLLGLALIATSARAEEALALERKIEHAKEKDESSGSLHSRRA